MSREPRWTPSAEQMALWPPISGNTINGVGEPDVRQPTPIYWHAPDATPHGPLQLWFYKRTSPRVMVARQERQAAIDLEVPPVSDMPIELDAETWSRDVKAAALDAGADIVGITPMQGSGSSTTMPCRNAGRSCLASRTTGTSCAPPPRRPPPPK